MKYIIISTSLLLIFIASCSTASIPGPQGSIGPKGEKGERGEVGPQGEKGQGIGKKKLIEIDKIITEFKQSNDEFIIGATSYSFGFAPKVTGFVYLTNKGKIFKLESKNPKTLGQKIQFLTQISENISFTSITKTASGEDIKQYFTTTTSDGDIYSSENLKDWKKLPENFFNQ
jgi:hypothetical protein